MGCGKSTVLEWFRDWGWPALSADAIVGDLLREDPAVRTEIVAALGDPVLDAQGKIDRKALGAIVFDCSERLRCLEAILHPRVRKVWKDFLNAHDRAIIEIPLLHEKELGSEFDHIICVICSSETQFHRLLQRGFDEQTIAARNQRQLPMQTKARLSDTVLWNDGSLDHLKNQVERVARSLQ